MVEKVIQVIKNSDGELGLTDKSIYQNTPGVYQRIPLKQYAFTKIEEEAVNWKLILIAIAIALISIFLDINAIIANTQRITETGQGIITHRFGDYSIIPIIVSIAIVFFAFISRKVKTSFVSSSGDKIVVGRVPKEFLDKMHELI